MRAVEARPNTAFVHDDERGDLADSEPLDKVWSGLGAHADEMERVVVATPLQHLRDVALDPAGRAGGSRVEVDEPRTLTGGDGVRANGNRFLAHAEFLSCSPAG